MISQPLLTSFIVIHHLTMLKEKKKKGDSLSLSFPCKASSLAHAVSISSKQVCITNTIPDAVSV